MNALRSFAIGLAGALASANSSAAQSEIAILDDDSASFFAEFGDAVAIDGDVAAVGAPSDYIGSGNYIGSVSVFRRVAGVWSFEQRLQAGAIADAFDFFGRSIAIDGDVMAVGAPGGIVLDVIGRVHIFRYDGSQWNEEDVLINGGVIGHFGYDVDLDGGRLAVVGYGYKDPSVVSTGLTNYVGAAWIYDFDGANWNATQQLGASDRDAGDLFGRSVALEGDRILVGASGESDPQLEDWGIGAFYAFERVGGNWVETQKVRATNASDSAKFGASIDMDGAVAVVGSPSKKNNGVFESGQAYIFEHDGNSWNEAAKVRAPEPQQFDRFGSTVGVDADVVWVGSAGLDTAGNSFGAVFAYRNVGGEWTAEPAFHGSESSAIDSFGSAVALDGGLAIVGELESSGVSPGQAYIFNTDSVFHLMPDPLPIVAGDDVKLATHFGHSGDITLIAYGVSGPGFLPLPFPGVALSIQAPQQLGGLLTADGAGDAQWEYPVPGGFSGLSLWLQGLAIDPGLAGAQVTNLIAATIE